MNLFWHCKDINNFGDILPKYVFDRLFIPAEWSNTDDNRLYMLSGSCMQDVKSNVICASLGFGASDQKVNEAPLHIINVRGKITRDMLLSQGIDCPETYGDFAYYLPFFFRKQSRDNNLYIPHYVDSDFEIDGYRTIDICSGVDNVMNELMHAKKVLTSSLHIMMVCEIFNIKYEFAHPFNEIAGDGMKYYDYFTTINKKFNPIQL